MPSGRVECSASTWQPPAPPAATPERAAVLDHIVERVLAGGAGRLRVVIDGPTAAGKSTLGHELAGRVVGHGRVALRASLDDFKRPWNEAHLYDRATGAGYYRDEVDPMRLANIVVDNTDFGRPVLLRS